MSGTIQASIVKDSASATNNLTLDTGGNATVGNTLVMGSSFLRNRIINGNMTIDQRNSGAQITAANLTTGSYMVDRWVYISSQAAKFTAQQNAGAVTSAVGFPNYLGMTVASAVTVGASDYFAIAQSIEGFNFADLAWGTASAKTITLSFQVYSSLTGTFGGAFINFAATRSYPFAYTVSSANTWTTVSITIPGDTSGTWVGSTNAGAASLRLSLGAGSTFSGTAGAWATQNYVSATGAVSVVGTASATFYVTGVQLEVGSVATPFERQIYSNQLAQCQRYYNQWNGNTATLGFTAVATGTVQTATTGIGTIPFPVPMRIAPTFSLSGGINVTAGASSTTVTSFVAQYTGANTNGANSGLLALNFAGSLTAGNSFVVYTDKFSTSIFAATAEL
jgi:hypothetical protein